MVKELGRLLIYGEKGIGKFEWIDSAIKALGSSRYLPIHEPLDIKAAHDIQSFLNKASQHPTYVVINNAETMNRHAANALLKTCETYEHIILVANNIWQLPRTLVSRFHKVFFKGKATMDEADIECAKRKILNGKHDVSVPMMQHALSTMLTSKELSIEKIVSWYKRVNQFDISARHANLSEKDRFFLCDLR